MPKLVNRDARRREITDAVRRLIARDGLEGATFQSVAAEAGFSVRLVQYYFGNKEAFLLATQDAVIADAGDRFAARWATLGDKSAPREAIRAVIDELLPLDEARRRDAVVLAHFHAAALAARPADAGTDATLAAPRAMVAVVAALLDRFATEHPESGVEPAADAELILVASAGLSQALLPGHYAPAQASELVDRLLDRVLGS
jgi:TetR/AcrR family transcriptional repressor of bet genes